MAILSKGITLSYKTSTGSTYTELTDLLEIPALGGTADKVETTTLADDTKRYIKGLKDYGDLSFKFNYDKTQFEALSALTGVINWKVELPDASEATFTGEPTVMLEGAGVGAVMTYSVAIALNSDITFA